MPRIASIVLLCAASVALSGSISVLNAQQAKGSPPAAPVPTQILTAKKVFVSNAGGDVNANLGDQSVYGTSPADPYNRFYDAMKTWGRYQVVDAPADADLVFEIRLRVRIDPGTVSFGNGSNSTDPQLRLRILDPKTGVTLWAFVEHAPEALLQSNRNKNLDAAVSTLVDDVKALVLPKS